MKPIYKVVSSTINLNNDYTPIQVLELSRARKGSSPHPILRVSINLVHGSVEVETDDENGLVIRPSSSRHIRVSKF